MTNVSNSNTSGITMVYLLTRKFPTLSNYNEECYKAIYVLLSVPMWSNYQYIS